MIHFLVACWSCINEHLYKHGRSQSGEPPYRCQDCHCCFQLNCRHEANKVGILEKIIA